MEASNQQMASIEDNSDTLIVCFGGDGSRKSERTTDASEICFQVYPVDIGIKDVLTCKRSLHVGKQDAIN